MSPYISVIACDHAHSQRISDDPYFLIITFFHTNCSLYILFDLSKLAEPVDNGWNLTCVIVVHAITNLSSYIELQLPQQLKRNILIKIMTKALGEVQFKNNF